MGIKKKKWSIRIVEYYSAMKRNEPVVYATSWMNLKNMMVSERRQIQETAYYI